MSAPSILFINRLYAPGRGATGRLLRDAAEAFAREGWSVSVLTTGDQTEKLTQNGVHIHRIWAPLKRQSALSYFFVWGMMLFRALRLPAHDVVVTMTDPPMQILIGRAFAKFKGARHMHWCQDVYPDLLPALNIRLPNFILRALRRLSRRAMKECDRVIVIGRCMARYLVQTGMALSDLTLITNWPDAEILDAAQPMEKMYDAPTQLVLDSRPKFRVLYAGRIGRGHSMRAITEAVITLNDTHPDIEFMFVGDDSGHERLARQRDKFDLTNIRMLPFQPPGRIKHIMESADLHLVSLNDEAAGLMVPSKFYSALAAGRPCLYIGPPDTEITQVIDHFKCGRTVANGDGAGLIASILAYREQPDVWQAGHAGALKAREVFMPAQSMAALIKRAVQVRKGQV